jgi:hypothetical protein
MAFLHLINFVALGLGLQKALKRQEMCQQKGKVFPFQQSKKAFDAGIASKTFLM